MPRILLQQYPEELILKVEKFLEDGNLDTYLLQKYPQRHSIQSQKLLVAFVKEIKDHYIKSSLPIHRICWDDKIERAEQYLGVHITRSKVQGRKLSSKKEIKIASLFKNAPECFLRMIVVHELAHLKYVDHNDAFYKFCNYMEPNYFQLEFDVRLLLILKKNNLSLPHTWE